MINELIQDQFREAVWAYYRKAGRHELPWRQAAPDSSFDAYKIMVSEVMLQQTQVARVIPKYQAFIKQFPDISYLAAAPQGEVLKIWNGLGYNRRAKFLHLAAKEIIEHHAGTVPSTTQELVGLPGIGINTAGAILAYAFNQPAVFMETNIRAVFLHHFFNEQTNVTDRAVLKQVEQTLDHQHPRQWYWALMDYGTFLKRTVPNPNQKSKHYTKQSQFQGSKRQLRGQILSLLSDRPYSKTLLERKVADERLSLVLHELMTEDLIQYHEAKYCL